MGERVIVDVSKSVEWITTFGHHGRMFVGDGNFKYLHLDPFPGGVNDPQPYRDYLKRIKEQERVKNGEFE
jgi:hypothetical protein